MDTLKLLPGKIFLRCVAVATVVLLTACAPPAGPKKRYFWPPYSPEPKIEYIDFIQADADVVKSSISRLEADIFGKDAPVPLFASPYDVYSDGNGMLYVTEPSQRFVHRIDLKHGKISQLTSSRAGRDLRLERPTGVTGTSDGSVYVVDSAAGSIEIFGADGRHSGSWKIDGVKRPLNLSIDEVRRRVYLVVPDQHRILVLSLDDGAVLSSFGKRGTEPGEFNFPLDIDLDIDGNIYVLDAMNARVQAFTPEGKFLRMFGERGTASGSFRIPKGIAVSKSGHVYVTDSMASRFVIFDLDGNYLMTIGGKYVLNEGKIAPGGFYFPEGVCVDSKEGIWIIDALNRIIHHFQYLDKEYLEAHPIEEGQAAVPDQPRKSSGQGRR